MFTITAGLIGTGNSVLCSRLIGGDSREKSNRIFSLSVLWAVLLSAILTSVAFGIAPLVSEVFCGAAKQELIPDVAAYIRGFSLGAPFIIFRQLLVPMVNIEGGSRHIHISSILILGGDAAMDYIFCAWFDAGCFGLGAASALSYVFGCIPLFVFFMQGRSSLKIGLKSCFSWSETLEIGKAGFPTAMKRVCNVIAPVMTNRFILTISSVGAMAALSVQSSSTRFLLCLVLAMSTTFLLIAGSFYGERDPRQMEFCIREMFKQSMLWSIGISALFFIFARPLALVFIHAEEEVVEMSVLAIRWYVVGVPFMALNQCAASYLQATKQLKASNWVIIADRLISTIILVYLLGWIFGEKGVFAAYGLSEVMLTVVLYILLCIRNKGLVTRFDECLLLPEDFGVEEGHYLPGQFRSGDEVIGFSEKVQKFCMKEGIERRKAMFAALCVEELAINIVSYGITKKDQNLTVRIFIEPDGSLMIRLRDDGKPFNLEKWWKLVEKDHENPAANMGIRLVFGIAREINYHSSFGMNNTVIII